MEPVAVIFRSHEEAHRADLEYYRRLTPAERLEILLALIEHARKEGDASTENSREFIASLNSQGVEYLVVGGYAMAYHGVPRFTGDIGFLVASSPENASRIERALAAFGFGSLGLSAKDFTVPGRVIQLGQPPNRIDLLTSITGVPFEEAWRERVAAELDGVPVNFIGREALIRNKRATARAQDLADLEALT